MKLIYNRLKLLTKTDSILVMVFKLVTNLLFGLSFFSIPALSFIKKFSIITWVFTIGTVLSMVVVLLFERKKIKIDFIFFSFLLFGIFAFLSSLINGLRAFVFTPILLAILSCIVYLYSVNNKDQIKPLLFSAYLGLVVFLFAFAFAYRDDLIHLHFSRLGSKFGDINDIALFMGLGSVLSFSLLLNVKKWYLKILALLMFFGFVLCGFSSTSKSFIFILGVCSLFLIFMFFGKKRWWLSLAISGGLIALFFIMINLPFLAGLKQRFLNMFSTLTQNERIEGNNNDLSTVDRLYMFLDGMTMWLRKPIFGYGIQGFFRASSYGGGWSHNHFSETLASFGLVGAFFYHYGYAKGIKGYLFTKRSSLKTTLGILFVFFVVCMFFVALNSQKIYAFLIPLPIAFFEKEKCICEITSLPLFLERRKTINAQNC